MAPPCESVAFRVTECWATTKLVFGHAETCESAAARRMVFWVAESLELRGPEVFVLRVPRPRGDGLAGDLRGLRQVSRADHSLVGPEPEVQEFGQCHLDAVVAAGAWQSGKDLCLVSTPWRAT
jgi:hypothetical protein